MKKLLLVAVVVFAAWAGYQYTQTGTLPFLSSAATTPEERQIDELAERFASARSRFQSALQSAGLTGTDLTADADAALEEVKRVEEALARLDSKLVSERAKQKAGDLKQAIRQFRSRL